MHWRFVEVSDRLDLTPYFLHDLEFNMNIKKDSFVFGLETL